MPVRCSAITIHRRQVMLLDPCWRSNTCSRALRCCMGRTEAVNAQHFVVCLKLTCPTHSFVRSTGARPAGSAGRRRPSCTCVVRGCCYCYGCGQTNFQTEPMNPHS